MILAFLDALFGGFRFYRRLCGGHWEHWLIDAPVNGELWIRQPHGERPWGGRGTPTCEDHDGGDS